MTSKRFKLTSSWTLQYTVIKSILKVFYEITSDYAILQFKLSIYKLKLTIESDQGIEKFDNEGPLWSVTQR